jgi:hypothetical protein
LAKDLPKAPKPYRSVKGSTNGGAKYVVRIIDERAREGSLPGFGGETFSEIKKVAQPTPSLAWYLPNNFEAEWSGLRVRFRVELFKNEKKPRWAISSLSVETLREGRSLEKLERLPLQSFLESAIHVATVECITYPPGYEGVMLGLNGEVEQGWKVTVPSDQENGEEWPIGWLGVTPREILHDFVASATDSSKSKKLNHLNRLKVVAKAYKKASERERYETVQKALGDIGDHVSKHRVKQLIKEAREAGLIPQSEKSKK